MFGEAAVRDLAFEVLNYLLESRQVDRHLMPIAAFQ
jgi:hypothetical protein